MQGDKIGLREHRVAFHEFGVQFLLDFSRQAHRIMVDNAHAKAARAAGHGAADAPKAE